MSADWEVRRPPAAAGPRHVLSLCVCNKPGVLVRVALVFARRGVNIDRLAVYEGDDPAFSHVTITAGCGEADLRLIRGQLNKLVDVVHAEERTREDPVRTASRLATRAEEMTAWSGERKCADG